MLLGELGEENGNGRGRRFTVRQEKKEKEEQTGWGERCDQGKQGKKKLHYSTKERVGIWKGN